MRISPLLALVPAVVLSAGAAEAASGDLDPTFGNSGVVYSSVGAVAEGRAAVLQADGKIVVAGSSDGSLLVLRYLPDGSLDAGFGSGGVVTTPVGDVASAAALVLQPDGRLVAAGTSTSGGQASVTLARYEDDGTPDTGFGSGGIVTTPLAAVTVYALVRQADGKLVVAGTSNAGAGGEFTLVRYEADGSIDGSFGTGGVVTTSLSAGADIAYALVLQRDQKLVAGGRPSAGEFALARYAIDGTLDPTFGSGGISITNTFTIGCRALALQPDGKIVGVGAGSFNGYEVAVVVRVEAGGTPDSTFVTNQPMFFPYGVRMYASSFGEDYQIPGAVAVDAIGRILFAGEYAHNVNPGVPHAIYVREFFAHRLKSDGTEDPTFPLSTWQMDSGPHGSSALLFQPDTKAVAVGSRASNVAALRFLTTDCGNGTVEPGEVCDDGNETDGDGCDDNCTPTTCGNGVVTAGESCDDGNLADGDCCDSACAFESVGSACTDDGNACRDDLCDGAGTCTHPATTGACDDGNACTTSDTCAGGTCQGGPAVECPLCESCRPLDGACIIEPRPDCAPAAAPEVSRLVVTDEDSNRRDQIRWQWLHGDASPASLGDPLGTQDYALCIYDESLVTPTLAFRAAIPAAGQCGTRACWHPNATGFRYRDPDRTPDGVHTLVLKSGTGSASIRFKGAGDLLSDWPRGLPAPPLAVPLRVQLQAAGGACWESAFSNPRTNESGRFDARSD